MKLIYTCSSSFLSSLVLSLSRLSSVSILGSLGGGGGGTALAVEEEEEEDAAEAEEAGNLTAA